MSNSRKGFQETRYWCEYCKMFVYNNPISKSKHEADVKHKSNLKRTIDLQIKQSKQKEREKQAVLAEISKIESSRGVKEALGVPSLQGPVASFSNVKAATTTISSKSTPEYVHGQMAVMQAAKRKEREVQVASEQRVIYAAAAESQDEHSSVEVDSTSGTIGQWIRTKVTKIEDEPDQVDVEAPGDNHVPSYDKAKSEVKNVDKQENVAALELSKEKEFESKDVWSSLPKELQTLSDSSRTTAAPAFKKRKAGSSQSKAIREKLHDCIITKEFAYK